MRSLRAVVCAPLPLLASLAGACTGDPVRNGDATTTLDAITNDASVAMQDSATSDGGTDATCGLSHPVGDAGAGPRTTTDAPPPCTVHVQAGGADVQTRVQTALIDANAGSTICFDDGTYLLTDELSVGTRGLTLRGTGTGAILDYRNQRVTARNGILATGDDFTIEDLAIVNTAGDAIRVEGAENVVFRRLNVSWAREGLRPDDAGVARSGAYAVYPVNCHRVLIEDCEVSGARDAALYVGQSTRAVVRDNLVHDNVAGIELENTTDGEVYGNHVYGNTAGILVFNLPDLPVQDGRRANVHHNRVERNNGENFGVPGTVVAGVPPGVGVLVLAADQTEVHDNSITENASTGVLVVSCSTNNTFMPCTSSVPYDNWPQGTWVHDNGFACNGARPAPIFRAFAAPVPLEDVVWDGDVDPTRATDPTARTCVTDNGAAARFRNFNAPGGLRNQVTDVETVRCTQPALAPVTL